MAKRDNTSPKNVPSFQPARGKSSWFWAVLCLLIALLLAVAFLDYRPEQSTHITTNPTDRNLVGRFGSEVSYYGFFLFGGAAWLLPVFLVWLAYLLMRGVRRFVVSRFAAMILCAVAFSGLLAMQDQVFIIQNVYNQGPGGALGNLIYREFLFDYLGTFGTGILLGAIYLFGLLFIIFRDLGSEFTSLGEALRVWAKKRAERRAEVAELKRLAREAQAKERERLNAATAARSAPPPEQKKFAIAKAADAATGPDAAKPAATAAGSRASDLDAPAKPETFPPPPRVKPVPTGPQLKGESAGGQAPAPLDSAPRDKKLSLKIVTPEETKKAQLDLPKSRGDYTFPTLDLLNEPATNEDAADEEEHARTAETLLRTLGEFGVEVSLGEVHIGPVITRYEIYPAPGVRVEKIASLDKNLALGLRAQSVRILAPVPGKGCVGVEVPNKKPTPVGIREILESEDWASAHAEIPLALGRDVGGKPVIADLARMPHLLIAGATGSGKTVCINSIITSLLYFASPDDLRFIMVDPKIVEMKAFNDLPHMLIPVVTDPKKVPSALRWLIAEMEMRYQIFGKVGVRNIAGFNGRKKLEKETPAAPSREERRDATDELGIEVPRDEEIEIPEKMPYIVCIIDELADLMMVAPADVENGIARLAQLARAAGIHLILATQRPSVNVITGVIKANLPCRIAFQVASKVDSRTILDYGGADQLIGRGDLLFSPPGTAKLVRAQGCYVSDDELGRVVEFLKRNGPPEYAEDVQRRIEEGEPDEDGGEEEGDENDDEMLPQAIDVLRSTRRASTSMLQRRLRIGYNRAARLMELLETKGIVGPENGSSPREILVDLDTL
jgi:DNA segregation ATPase FtsK/SpoIIIE, S-DNA-T family